MAVTDAEIRMWAMDRALDSFNRKNWADAFLRAGVLCVWAKDGAKPPLLDNGDIDLEKFLENLRNKGGFDG
ncbi:hypothetical protein [Acetobacter sp. KSO5]|uniref:hypothetical protein n=1 Tax=Acetobacter sp. KSO5 TaxID=3373674 RepID=UPI00376F3E6D